MLKTWEVDVVDGDGKLLAHYPEIYAENRFGAEYQAVRQYVEDEGLTLRVTQTSK